MQIKIDSVFFMPVKLLLQRLSQIIYVYTTLITDCNKSVI
jgi:hypothetical protein